MTQQCNHNNNTMKLQCNYNEPAMTRQHISFNVNEDGTQQVVDICIFLARFVNPELQRYVVVCRFQELPISVTVGPRQLFGGIYPS